MMDTSTMVKGPAAHGALKPEAMYHSDSSELPYMKAHTDPGPDTLQRVRNDIDSYFLNSPYCADGREYNTYYHEAEQKQISTGGGGLALPVIQHSSWGNHSTSPLTVEYPHQPHPTLNQPSNYTSAPPRGHLLTRTRSNGSSIASNGTVAPSPAESMLSSASIETARTNYTYPGTRRVENANIAPSLRNRSAVSTFDRHHTRHHSHPAMNGSTVQHSSKPLQRTFSQGGSNHAYPSRHNLLPPLQSSKGMGYDLCDTLPSFSDVQSTSSCSIDAYRIPSSVDIAHNPQQPEYVACQQPMQSGHEQFVFDSSIPNGSHIMHLPSYSEAMCTRVASNMILGDSSTHLMSLPRETSFLECLHDRQDMEGLF